MTLSAYDLLRLHVGRYTDNTWEPNTPWPECIGGTWSNVVSFALHGGLITIEEYGRLLDEELVAPRPRAVMITDYYIENPKE